jgi:hypothetical protein
MERKYFKLASYYVIFDDESGGCSVKFYDRDGNKIKNLYFSWEKRNENFKQILDNKLDKNHKGNMRPKKISIYESELGRTIGFYDKNDNLVYFKKFYKRGELNDILNDETLNLQSIIDVNYLKKTKKVKIINYADSYTNSISKAFIKYWNSFKMWRL